MGLDGGSPPNLEPLQPCPVSAQPKSRTWSTHGGNSVSFLLAEKPGINPISIANSMPRVTRGPLFPLCVLCACPAPAGFCGANLPLPSRSAEICEDLRVTPLSSSPSTSPRASRDINDQPSTLGSRLCAPCVLLRLNPPLVAQRRSRRTLLKADPPSPLIPDV